MEHVIVTVELDAEQAWALAQLVKRIGWADCRSLAEVGVNGGEPVVFQLVGRDGETTADQSIRPTDLLFWSWIPIFCDRARKLVLELGGSHADFARCEFASVTRDEFFLHLPAQAFDIVDLAASQFTMTIPMSLRSPMASELCVCGMSRQPCLLASGWQYLGITKCSANYWYLRRCVLPGMLSALPVLCSGRWRRASGS